MRRTVRAALRVQDWCEAYGEGSSTCTVRAALRVQDWCEAYGEGSSTCAGLVCGVWWVWDFKISNAWPVQRIVVISIKQWYTCGTHACSSCTSLGK